MSGSRVIRVFLLEYFSPSCWKNKNKTHLQEVLRSCHPKTTSHTLLVFCCSGSFWFPCARHLILSQSHFCVQSHTVSCHRDNKTFWSLNNYHSCLLRCSSWAAVQRCDRRRCLCPNLFKHGKTSIFQLYHLVWLTDCWEKRSGHHDISIRQIKDVMGNKQRRSFQPKWDRICEEAQQLFDDWINISTVRHNDRTTIVSHRQEMLQEWHQVDVSVSAARQLVQKQSSASCFENEAHKFKMSRLQREGSVSCSGQTVCLPLSLCSQFQSQLLYMQNEHKVFTESQTLVTDFSAELKASKFVWQAQHFHSGTKQWSPDSTEKHETPLRVWIRGVEFGFELHFTSQTDMRHWRTAASCSHRPTCTVSALSHLLL